MRVALLGLCAAAAAAAAASPLTRVHVVPHSHNDPGWLETESQYFKIRSKMIITNVVKSLEADPKRRFQWVEMVYFREWWGEQDAATQGRVRALVAARRLIFLTGGLCMNDEAISHHGAVIDQMTWGHRFINETFGPDALPTVGWQIDAFGHGAGYTSLTAAMGIKAMIGQKIDFQDQARRAAAQELEFRWTADPTNHPNRSVFGHIMFDNTGGYSFTLPQIKPGGMDPAGQPKMGVTIQYRTANCTGGPPSGNGCCKTECHTNCSSCAAELGAETIAARVAKMVPEYRHGSRHVFFAFGSDFRKIAILSRFVALSISRVLIASPLQSSATRRRRSPRWSS